MDRRIRSKVIHYPVGHLSELLCAVIQGGHHQVDYLQVDTLFGDDLQGFQHRRQGSAADLIKMAMINIHRELPQVSPSARMLLQIHDELVFEAPDAELDAVCGFVREKMSGAMELDVPLKVDVGTGKNWEEVK